MATPKKQDKSFVPGKTETEKADDKKKSFEQGLQNNNTTDETGINPLPVKKKKGLSRKIRASLWKNVHIN